MRTVTLLILLLVLAPDASPSEPTAIALPRPEGVYSVGYWRTSLRTGELDHLTPDPDDVRRLALEIWYPASDDSAGQKRYASDFVDAGLAEAFPLPAGFSSAVKTSSYTDATPAKGSFPVVIFSHGLSWPVTLYQSFTEDLASRGYVVIGVNHPHGVLIEYEEGRRLGREAWPQIEDETARQEMLARHLAVWTRDLQDVVDEVARWSANTTENPVAPLVNVDRLGVAGHSYGGSAAAALADPRVRAIGVMEAAVRTEDGYVRSSAPLIHLIGGYNRLELEGSSYRPSPGAPVYQVIINGTGHAYFSDLIHIYRNYADEAWRSRHRYEVVPDRVIQISRDYLAAFFDRYLKGEKTHVLLEPKSYSAKVKGPQQAGYPEVELSISVQ